MSLARFWSTFKLLNLSKPIGDRPLYRAVRGRRVSSVLEINASSFQRSERLIHWLREQGMAEGFRYAVIDPFEMGGSDRLTLKGCHSMLSKLGAKPFPVPMTGSLATALTRVAHTIGSVDLLVADCPAEQLDEATVRAIMPRIIHADSLVMGQSRGSDKLVSIDVHHFTSEPIRKVA